MTTSSVHSRGAPIPRRLRADDIDRLLDLYEAVAAEGRWIGAEAPVDRRAKEMQWRDRFFGDAPAVCFVIEMGGRIAAWAWVMDIGVGRRTGVVELGMGVARDHRAQGLGTTLLRRCLEWARAAGAHKVTLQVWPHNVAAVALYERHGFEREGYLRRHWRRRNGEIWDAIVMGLVLDDDAPS